MAIDIKMMGVALGDPFLKKPALGEEKQAAYFKYETDAFIEKMGPYANNVRRIQVETNRETKETAYYDIRLTDVVDPGTGASRGDNWKKVSFFTTHPKIVLGMKFFFANNTWLCINMNDLEGEGDSAVLHRCTNVLSWLDQYGNVISEPCIMTKDVIENNANISKPEINITKGDKAVYVQYNNNTMGFKDNDRFIVGRTPWMVRGLDLTQRQSTTDSNSVRLIPFTLYKDDVRKGDDLINGIANADVNKWIVTISQKQIEGNVGETGNILAMAYVDGVLVDDVSYHFSSSDTSIVSINESNGNYELIAEGHAIIKCALSQNTNIYDESEVIVQAGPVTNYSIIVTPEIKELRQYSSQLITAHLYENQIPLEDAVSFAFNGVDERYYLLSNITDNGFTIKCISQYLSNPLTVVCSTSKGGLLYSKTLSIWLKNAY